MSFIQRCPLFRLFNRTHISVIEISGEQLGSDVGLKNHTDGIQEGVLCLVQLC